MEIELSTPALLFPAVSLLFLSYTNRFLALSGLIRKLHDEWQHYAVSPEENDERLYFGQGELRCAEKEEAGIFFPVSALSLSCDARIAPSLRLESEKNLSSRSSFSPGSTATGDGKGEVVRAQILNLRHRLVLIRWMQVSGAVSLLLCVISMVGMLLDFRVVGLVGFGGALCLMGISLVALVREASISGGALRILLDQAEELRCEKRR